MVSGLAFVRTEHGEFSGRSLAAIVRREYGRRAVLRRSADPNDVNFGLILEPVTWNPGAWRVLARVREAGLLSALR